MPVKQHWGFGVYPKGERGNSDYLVLSYLKNLLYSFYLSGGDIMFNLKPSWKFCDINYSEVDRPIRKEELLALMYAERQQRLLPTQNCFRATKLDP